MLVGQDKSLLLEEQYAVALVGRPGVEDHNPEYPHRAQKDPGYLVQGQTLPVMQPANSGH